MHQRLKLFGFVLSGLLSFHGPMARADVKPHSLFTDNMVLQQGIKVPVWGTAADGEKVTVRFQDQEISATARGGKWSVELDKLRTGGPFEMTLTGQNRVHLKNVFVGEVWVASGQSNMEWPLSAAANAKQAIADSANEKIHLFTVPKTVSATPLDEIQGHPTWQECGPSTVGHFSAVAYFFGRDLQKALKVPVGIIHTSWGGTVAEAWTSSQGLEARSDLKYMARTYKPDEKLNNPNLPSVLYNGMIAPLIPYANRGAIWYQGESNAGRAYEYRSLFPAMIGDWRKHWREGDFPFLFVQLAPWQAIVTEPQESAWAELREAQLLTSLKVPNTGMAVITDVGDPKDIHPRQKEPVGARLALAAEALAYAKNIEYSGPVYESMKAQGNQVMLSFAHVDGGLEARGGTLQGFTIAGPDRRFVNAQAEIKGDKVVVSSPDVQKPVAVRYGWANCPVVNLWNKSGLPASPFRTDDFPMVTGPKASEK